MRIYYGVVIRIIFFCDFSNQIDNFQILALQIAGVLKCDLCRSLVIGNKKSIFR